MSRQSDQVAKQCTDPLIEELSSLLLDDIVRHIVIPMLFRVCVNYDQLINLPECYNDKLIFCDCIKSEPKSVIYFNDSMIKWS